MAFKIDLSKFKKISSDKDHTTLQHDDGHSIKIAHKALSSENRKQLHKLPIVDEAIGGQIDSHDDVPEPNPEAAKAISKGSQESGWQPKRWKDNVKEGLGLNKSRGGEVASNEEPARMYADGGEVEDSQNKPITINIGTPNTMQPVPQALQQGAPAAVNPEGNAIPQQMPPQSQPFTMGNVSAQDLMPQAEATQESRDIKYPEAAKEEPKAPEAVQAGPAPASVAPVEQPGMGQMPVQQAPQQPNGEVPNPLDAYHKGLEGIRGQAAAEANLSKQLETQYKAKAKAEQDIQNQYQDGLKQINQDISETIDDLKNGHIDPNHFFGSMDTQQRMLTGIGLALSGFGAGLTGGPNTALDFINKQIDRDIDAQKANLGKKQSLLSAYYHQFGNLTEATNMAKLTMASVFNSNIQAATAKAGSALAASRGKQLEAALAQQTFPILQQTAMNRMLMEAKSGQGAAGGGSEADVQRRLGLFRALGDKTATEDLQSRYLPGIGEGHTPIPAADRNNIVEKTNLLENVRKLREFAAKHQGSIAPATIAEGKALSNIVLNQLRTATDQGVIKPSEIEFDRKLVDEDPTKFFGSFRTDPKYKTLENWATQELHSKLEEYGLPTDKIGSVGKPKLNALQQSFADRARANLNNPDPAIRQKAQILLKKLGVE